MKQTFKNYLSLIERFEACNMPSVELGYSLELDIFNGEILMVTFRVCGIGAAIFGKGKAVVITSACTDTIVLSKVLKEALGSIEGLEKELKALYSKELFLEEILWEEDCNEDAVLDTLKDVRQEIKTLDENIKGLKAIQELA